MKSTAQLSSITESELKNRAEVWWKELNSSSSQNSYTENLFQENIGKLKAADLYIGSYWSKIRQLPSAAQLSGFEPYLWVISAGYGLISAEDYINPYSATFSQNDNNSVTKGQINGYKREDILQSWWNLISTFSLQGRTNPRSLSQLIRQFPNEYFLVIASSEYLRAIQEDLINGIQFLTSIENLIIITSPSYTDKRLEKNLIPSNAKLQCNGECEENCKQHLIVRGIRGSISASLALKIVDYAKNYGFNAENIKQYVEKYIEKSPNLLSYNRIRLNDCDVLDFIKRELINSPSPSCTQLLRRLREKGIACEQKRFKQLYWEVKDNCG